MTERKKAKSRDAIAMLKEDHKAVQKIFKDFEKAKDEVDDQTKEEMVKAACEELKIHTQIEEEIFYPALREALDEQDDLDEAKVEHQSAKQLIEELQSMHPGDELYDAKFTVLGEYVNHHIKEEESEMFPKAKKTDIDFKELGEQLEQRKNELGA